MSLIYKLHYKIYHYFSQQFQTLSLKIFFNTKKSKQAEPANS